MKNSVFWDITLCSPLKVSWHFGGTSSGSKQSSAWYLLHAGFLLGLFFDPEDGGDMFLRTLVDYQRTTQHYIPEDRTLQNCSQSSSSFWMMFQDFIWIPVGAHPVHVFFRISSEVFYKFCYLWNLYFPHDFFISFRVWTGVSRSAPR
jgi:hypothetical protein